MSAKGLLEKKVHEVRELKNIEHRAKIKEESEKQIESHTIASGEVVDKKSEEDKEEQKIETKEEEDKE